MIKDAEEMGLYHKLAYPEIYDEETTVDEQEILKMIRRTFHSQSGLFLNRRQSEDVALYIIKLINEDKNKL